MATSSHRECGTQAGIYDIRPIASAAIELLDKCHEVHEVFKNCQRELEQSRGTVVQSEAELAKLNRTVEEFSDAMDALGMGMLQDNLSVPQVNGQVERLKREIAIKKAQLETSLEEDESWERVRHLKQHRNKLELQLKRIKSDIDAQHEELFHMQQKVDAIKVLREVKQEDYVNQLNRLEEEARDYPSRRQQILDPQNNRVVNMGRLLVNPVDLRRQEAEIDDMTHQQRHVDRHIQMQREEHEYLENTSRDILERVYSLENQVRKETGDHCWESGRTREPNWYIDVGMPSVWSTMPTLTRDQLNLMLQRVNRRPMVDKAIGTDYMVDQAIWTDERVDQAIEADGIVDQAIGPDELVDQAVGTNELADQAVRRNELADRAGERNEFEGDAIMPDGGEDYARDLTDEILDKAMSRDECEDKLKQLQIMLYEAIETDEMDEGMAAGSTDDSAKV